MLLESCPEYELLAAELAMAGTPMSFPLGSPYMLLDPALLLTRDDPPGMFVLYIEPPGGSLLLPYSLSYAVDCPPLPTLVPPPGGMTSPQVPKNWT